MNLEVAVNPKMITLGRQTRGLSQKDLSERLNVSASTLSRIENAIGFLPIEENLLNDISSVLNFDTTFFIKPGDIQRPDMGYFRKNKSVSQKKTDQAVGYMNIYLSIIDSYLDLIEIPDLNIISWDIEMQGSPESAALNLREHWKLPKGRIDRISPLIENNGIIIIEFDFQSDTINGFSILTRKHGRPVIFVNSEFTEDRKRLTIAHELGHIILHINDYTISDYRDIEKEAFNFASEFLVPLREFKAQLGSNQLNLAKLGSLKQYWKTSMKFFVYKAQHNSIISSNQARYLYQQLAPYRKKEPVEIPVLEKPNLLGEMMYLIENELKYTVNELAKMIGMKTLEFSSLRNLAMKNNTKLRIA